MTSVTLEVGTFDESMSRGLIRYSTKVRYVVLKDFFPELGACTLLVSNRTQATLPAP